MGDKATEYGRARGWALRILCLGLGVSAGLTLGNALLAASLEARPGAQAGGGQMPIDVRADRLNYNRTRGEVEAVGNVVIRRGTDELRAGFVRYNVETGEAHAEGNVVLTRGTDVWRGARLDYNLKTGVGVAENLTFDAPPFRVVGCKTAEKKTGDLYIFTDTKVTTCTNAFPHCHYHVRARRLEVVPDESVTARGATWYFGPVPVMYLPYWHRNLRDHNGFRFVPGYGSKVGGFLLSAYSYPLAGSLRGQTHLDYRTKRGWGGGQDFDWDVLGGGRGRGGLSMYYARDRDPWEQQEDPALSEVDRDRYRFDFRQAVAVTERDTVFARGQYLSDPDVLEDFFEDDYRRESEPDNHLVYAHRGNNYTVNVGARKRLNDFFTSVERLPETTVNFMRRELGASGLFYEGRTSAGYLQKSWAEREERADYSAFRFDTANMLYRPSRHFGFLNVVPRGGYRGTCYSATKKTVEVTETRTVAKSFSVVEPSGATSTVVRTVTETNVVARDIEQGAGWRSRVEAGVEAAFKAFKTWQGADGSYRHIAEPYANYTLAPRPNLTPEQLYQFDEVDALDEEHHVRLGARNKIQVKQVGRSRDLLDADVYTICRIHREPGQDAVENLFFDSEMHPTEFLAVDIDGILDISETDVDRFNVRVRETVDGFSEWSAEYRFKKDESSLLSAEITFLPKRAWTYNLYGRYELDGSRFEEIGGYIQRNLDCLAIRGGLNLMPGYTRTDGTKVEDDIRFVFGIWLQAFPEFGINQRHFN